MRKNFEILKKEVEKYPRLNIDDYGLPIMLWFIYSIAGNEYFGQYLAIIFNALVVSLSTLYLYKTMLFLKIKPFYSRFFCAVFGFFPFFNIISANGAMKENLFCFLIILFFYYMYKYKFKREFASLMLCLFFIFPCILFRLVIPVMMLITFFIQLFSSEKNKKIVIIFLVICFVFGVIFLDLIIMSLFSKFLSSNLKFALDSKFYGSVWFRWLVQVVSVLFGPFPNFNRSLVFGIMYNSGLFFKVMFSFYLLLGICNLVKNLEYDYYPVVIYVLMGMFFCSVWGVALNMRFQITFFPLMLLIMAYAIQECKLNKIMYYIYAIFSSGLIIAYNIR
jgi:hypothetical protein